MVAPDAGRTRPTRPRRNADLSSSPSTRPRSEARLLHSCVVYCTYASMTFQNQRKIKNPHPALSHPPDAARDNGATAVHSEMDVRANSIFDSIDIETLFGFVRDAYASATVPSFVFVISISVGTFIAGAPRYRVTRQNAGLKHRTLLAILAATSLACKDVVVARRLVCASIAIFFGRDLRRTRVLRRFSVVGHHLATIYVFLRILADKELVTCLFGSS